MTETRTVPATPEPVEQSHDLYGGVTTWEVDPFEVTATTGTGLIPERAVSLDGRGMDASTARLLAAVLLSAADQVEGSR